MSINDDNNIPESKKQELLDMAYNILPGGAEYDVFSENISEIKPSLLYDDIQPQKAPKEERHDNEPHDMFAENEGNVKSPEQNLNREYLNVLYQGGIDLSKDDIRLTRSDYIADYNRINEYYYGEKKKCKKNFLGVAIIFAFGIAVLYIIELLQLNTPVEIVPRVVNPIYRILNGIRAGVFVANPIVSGFFFISTIKSMKNIKKSRKKAIDRLEQRKQELMILGLYDLSN